MIVLKRFSSTLARRDGSVATTEALIPYNLACYSCVEGDILGARGLLAFAFSMDEGLRLTALDDQDLDAIFGAGKTM